MPGQSAQRVAEVRTEHLLGDLLAAQGWDTRRPPNGNLLRQQEYKDYPTLAEIFKGRSKSGGHGDALPEAVLVDHRTLAPLAVVEAKARKEDLEQAENEVKAYANACIEAGHASLAIALAGTAEDGFTVSVFKWTTGGWKPVTYEGQPIGWIPNRRDVDRLLPTKAPTELRPTVPPPEVLAAHADEINRLLRESGVQDQFRPAVVAAVMLALWQSKREIRRSEEHILQDINQACSQAFWKTRKPELAKTLTVDEANRTLAIKARRIVVILERLNVTVLTAEHDYLGQLYETFFQYTGGNTIGQYFTPRHIAALMADLVQTDSEDIVLDPACGTGGFLIAAMHRVHKLRKLSREQVIELVGDRLIGFDQEPITAALCIANMILRGDGSTGIHRDNVFTAPEFPVDGATVVLMNPPFPHRKTDTPPEDFLFRGMEALRHRGRAAVILPTSELVKREKKSWRKRLLEGSTLDGVIGLPDDLFEPFASSYTSVVLITKGIPHPPDREVFFARITNDGTEVQKRVKVARSGEELTAVFQAYQEHRSIAGLCGWAEIDPNSLNFGPGLSVPPRPLTREDLMDEVHSLIRNRTAFVVRHAPRLFELEQAVARGEITPTPYETLKGLKPADPGPQTVGGYFHITYGQGELENKRGLQPGPALVISSSGIDNGCYGFFDFENLIAPPFASVPRTGSIGMAHVQEWPCGVTSDCLILTPKSGVPPELLYIASAVIRSEAWRYNYGMKITPERIADYPIPVDDEILGEITRGLKTGKQIDDIALVAAEDEADAAIARQRLAHVEDDPNGLVGGEELRKALSEIVG